MFGKIKKFINLSVIRPIRNCYRKKSKIAYHRPFSKEEDKVFRDNNMLVNCWQHLINTPGGVTYRYFNLYKDDAIKSNPFAKAVMCIINIKSKDPNREVHIGVSLVAPSDIKNFVKRGVWRIFKDNKGHVWKVNGRFLSSMRAITSEERAFPFSCSYYDIDYFDAIKVLHDMIKLERNIGTAPHWLAKVKTILPEKTISEAAKISTENK